jgi:hypothetical protein
MAGMPRVFAWSDLHADLPENMRRLRDLPRGAYQDATLLLAGDVSDDLAVLRQVLGLLREKFARVFFVPGNHELWVRRREAPDSLAKLRLVQALCAELGVETGPALVGARAGDPGDPGVWVVPLLAWYAQPEEGPDSLFLEKPGEDPTLRMWSDRYFTAWPALPGGATVAGHLLAANEPLRPPPDGAPVITLSHFLPRRDLILGSAAERAAAAARGLADPYPAFNFSRVAGSAGLERQLRRLGARVHVYGHQHRSRDRCLDGVRYVSHCLGYPRERQHGYLAGAAEAPAPVWGPGAPTAP